MSERKPRIMFASLLKPVNDTRMHDKMATTLAQTGMYEVHVIGFPGSPLTTHAGISIYPLPLFGRLSFKRFMVRFRVLRIIISNKPDLLIICTHELLRAGIVAKMLTGCRLAYDVQENYYLNIRHGNTFPKMLRPVIAALVRVKEVTLSPFISHFFLAERSYKRELGFVRSRCTILENKLLRSSVPIRKSRGEGPLTLLFSGTLHEQTGIFRAIDLIVKLRTVRSDVRLRIVGYCSREETWFKIRNTIEPYGFIEMEGGDHLVPHDRIMQAIAEADFGIVSYELTPATAASIPTKLYEYLGARLPLLLFSHPPWNELCNRYGAAIIIDRNHTDIRGIAAQMTERRFYSTAPEDVFWESESAKFVEIISKIV